ncbi:MAG: hypothetical protein AAF399_18890, partial [Bacteroidota bacterium]
ELVETLDLAGMYHCEELRLFWKVSRANGAWMIENTKWGEVALQFKGDDSFVPRAPIASGIQFQRNDAEESVGFLLNRGSRARSLQFRKISLK